MSTNKDQDNLGVLQVQEWLNDTYGSNSNFVPVDIDGIAGNSTCKALVRAMQIELGVSPVDGVWGDDTSSAFTPLSVNSNSSNASIQRQIYILQGGFYCKGIEPGGFDGTFGESTEEAVRTLESQAGLSSTTGIASAMLMKALLTTDAYTLLDEGDSNVRTIQQSLNNQYNSYIGLIPCDGLFSRVTSKAMVTALQVEQKKEYPTVVVDGIWGPNTQNRCPTLRRYGTVTNKQYVYLLQYALYVNGFDPNGFDGAFGAGAQTAVTNFQAFVGLTADGIVGKQTWASLMVSYGDPDRSCTAGDCMHPLTEETAALLVEAGRTSIGRYLVGGENKKLTIEELQIIKNAGLKVFPIFQRNARDASEFTYSQGWKDAADAFTEYKNLRFPSNGTVYFAVDYDVLTTDITTHILPYFRGIRAQLNMLNDSDDNTFNAGVYGPRYVCTRLYEEGLTTASFVSDMSSGFSCNIGYPLPQNWAFDQIKNTTISNTVCSMEIDNVIASSRETSVAVDPGSYYQSAEYDVVSNVNNALGLRFVLVKYQFNYTYDQEICVCKTDNIEVYYKLSLTSGFEAGDDANVTNVYSIVNGAFSDPTIDFDYGNISTKLPLVSVTNFPSIALAVKAGNMKVSLGMGQLSNGKPATVITESVTATPTEDNGLSNNIIVSVKILIDNDSNGLSKSVQSAVGMSDIQTQLYEQILDKAAQLAFYAYLTTETLILLVKIFEAVIEFFWGIIPSYSFDTTLDELNDLLDNQVGMP